MNPNPIVKTAVVQGEGGSAEIVAVQTLEGADHVTVVSTSAGVTVEIAKGDKRETFDIATPAVGGRAKITKHERASAGAA